MSDWSSADGRVTITITAHVAHVRLNRPDKMNALDPAMFDAIIASIAALETMPGVRVAVVSGEGRAFCAGLDLASMASGGASAGKDLNDRTHGDANSFQQVAWGWRTLPMPVIAAAHGVAFGGGLQIMSGADIRIVHPATRIAVMEMKWGLVPDMAGFPLWRGSVRDDILRELTYTNREFTGADAVALGFATHVSDDPLVKAMELAREIVGRNPDAIRGAKRLCNATANIDDAALLALESREQAAVIRQPNQVEAVRAGMEGRAPVFVDPS